MTIINLHGGDIDKFRADCKDEAEFHRKMFLVAIEMVQGGQK
jgi:hypothetical protein